MKTILVYDINLNTLNKYLKKYIYYNLKIYIKKYLVII